MRCSQEDTRADRERAEHEETKRRLAVVDDDLRLLESLGELLESAGYAVRTFSSAQNASSHSVIRFRCSDHRYRDASYGWI